MISSARLRETVEDSGFRVRHWRDRRAEALPSAAVWRRRLRAVPVGQDPHIETLRTWSERVASAPHEWGRSNPLIEVMAD